MKKQAIWNNQVIAESDDLVNIEGNYYFPRASISEEYFENSDTQSVCPWKGTANYLSVKVNGNENIDAAWHYPEAKISC